MTKIKVTVSYKSHIHLRSSFKEGYSVIEVLNY